MKRNLIVAAAVAAATIVAVVLGVAAAPASADYFDCTTTANAPYKSGGYVGGNGYASCSYHHDSLALTVCLQAYDNVDGWINYRCASDCRGNCTGVFYNTGYGLYPVANCSSLWSRYRITAVASWPYLSGWKSSAVAVSSPSYIAC